MLHAEPGIAAATQYLEIAEEVQDGGNGLRIIYVLVLVDTGRYQHML